MTTCVSESQHCVQAFREGCESYLVKPFQQEALIEQVRSFLGDLPAIHQNCATCG